MGALLSKVSLEYLAELLSVISVILIWIPAFKVSSALKLAQEMRSISEEEAGALTEIARKAKAVLERSHFSAKDHWMLLCGFSLAVASSVVKVLWVIGS